MTGKVVRVSFNTESLSGADFATQCRKVSLVFREALRIIDDGDWPKLPDDASPLNVWVNLNEREETKPLSAEERRAFDAMDDLVADYLTRSHVGERDKWETRFNTKYRYS